MSIAAATVTPTMTRTAGRWLVIVTRGRDRGREDFRLQRLVLERIEIPALRIVASGLPAGNDSAGIRIELAASLDVEAEAGQAALDFAALVAVEAELVFSELARFFCEGGGIDANTGRERTGCG